MVGLIGSGGAGGSIDADEVLSIVDGSDVKVAEAVVADGAAAAEDADALGGQPPSSYETPGSTQSASASGDWQGPADGVYIDSLYVYGSQSDDGFNQTVELTARQRDSNGDVERTESVSVEIDAGESAANTRNISPMLMTDWSFNEPNYDRGSYAEIHVLTLPEHSHSL